MERPQARLTGLDMERAADRGPNAATVGREQQFAAGRGVREICAQAARVRAETVVNGLAKFVRAGLAPAGAAARLVAGVEEVVPP